MLGPAVVVVAGVVTLWLAVVSNDGLVADDYYKQGIAINQTLARSDRAKALALSAKLRVTADRVIVILAARAGYTAPSRLRITFSHPTRGGLDQAEVLEQSSGAYEGLVPALAAGRWQVVLEDDDRTWRLAGAIRIPEEAEIELGGAL
jgi:hypothetical protein